MLQLLKQDDRHQYIHSLSSFPHTFTTDVTHRNNKRIKLQAYRSRDAKTVEWLTLLSKRVAGGDAVSVGDHTGEGAQILQGGTVEDSSGPGDEDTTSYEERGITDKCCILHTSMGKEQVGQFWSLEVA